MIEMSNPTDATLERATPNERVEMLTALVDDLRPDGPENVFDAATQTLVDAMLERDDESLGLAIEVLGRAEPELAGEWLGRLRGLIALCYAALDRLPSKASADAVGVRTHAHRMLRTLVRRGSMRSSDLATLLEVDPTEISRTGGTLAREGLASRTKAGRDVYWDISPRGRNVAASLDERTARTGVRRQRRWDAHLESSTEPDRIRESITHSRELLTGLLENGQEEIVSRLWLWQSFKEFAYEPPTFVAGDWTATYASIAGDRSELHRWWPTETPTWDAHAVVAGPKGVKGLVLVEAKSSPVEFRDDPIVGSEEQRSIVFDRRYREARKYLEVGRGADWRRSFPDAASRIAFLYFLRMRCEIPTWMVDVYFVASETIPGVPSSEEQWHDALTTVRHQLKLPEDHALSSYVRDEFMLAPGALAFEPA